MKINRRLFLKGTSAAVVLLPACGGSSGDGDMSEGDGPGGVGGPGGGNEPGGSPEPGPEPDPWNAPGSADESAFAWGVQVGDATSTGAVVSIRTTEAALALHVMRGTSEGWVEEKVVEDLGADDRVVQVELDELASDHTYSIAFYSPDGQRRSQVGRFRTAPAPERSRVIRFGATSCLGGNRPWSSLSHLADERLDFFLLLGDTIYADWENDDGAVFDAAHYEAKWEEALSTGGLKDLAASTSLVATWDDHEVDNNWDADNSSMQNQAQKARRAFRRALPQRLGQGDAIWRQMKWGEAVELFVLDCRSERTNGNYISNAQMSWLKAGLSASTARFKVILNSVPITDLSSMSSFGSEDRWEGFSAQRSELLDHIASDGVEGVFWVTGDYHIGAAGNVDAAGGPAANQWEVMAGPGGSPINFAANFFSPNDQIPLLVKEHNAVLFEADPDAGTIRFQFIGDDGSVIEERTIQA